MIELFIGLLALAGIVIGACVVIAIGWAIIQFGPILLVVGFWKLGMLLGLIKED